MSEIAWGGNSLTFSNDALVNHKYALILILICSPLQEKYLMVDLSLLHSYLGHELRNHL